MPALGAEVHVGHDQRLSVDLVVHFAGEEEAELVGVHIARGEDAFAQIRAASGQIVVLGQHGHVGPHRVATCQKNQCEEQTLHRRIVYQFPRLKSNRRVSGGEPLHRSAFRLRDPSRDSLVEAWSFRRIPRLSVALSKMNPTIKAQRHPMRTAKTRSNDPAQALFSVAKITMTTAA